MNQVFHFRRVLNLARKDFFDIWRGAAIAMGTVLGVILLIGVWMSLTLGRSMNYAGFCRITLTLGCCIAASRAFRELHDKSKNENYLLLPASALEKVFVRLLFVILLLPILIILTVLVGSLLVETGRVLGLKQTFEVFNPFQRSIWKNFGNTAILLSVFFLGAAWFKRAHFLKTLLTLALFGTVFGLLEASTVLRVFLAGFNRMDSLWGGFPNTDAQSSLPAALNILKTLFNTVYYVLLAPFCWFVAWLRVKEAQSHDGI